MTESDCHTLLLCRPNHFDILYEINAWMHLERRVDRERAVSQWERLHRTLQGLARLEYIDPAPGVPDLVFTANGGLVWGDSVVLSRFTHPERQKEEPLWEACFRRLGFRVLAMDGWNFEGAGDALFVGRTLVGGYGFRTQVGVYPAIGQALGVETMPVRLTDPRFYHLDTCFCPLDSSTVMLYPGGFAPESLAALRERFQCIEVSEAEAVLFACNAVVIGENVVLSEGCPQLAAALEGRGYTVHPVDMSEFHKSGGSAKCLTLLLKGAPVSAMEPVLVGRSAGAART